MTKISKSPQKDGLSVVLPVYNEEIAVSETILALRSVLRNRNIAHEILVVDDGSTDKTLRLVTEIPGITILRHTKNRGYGEALKTGIRQASFAWVCIIDADGTYPVEVIPRLFAHQSDSDMVVGARVGENVNYSVLRAIPKFFLRLYVNWVTQEAVPDFNSGLRIFRRQLILRYLPIFPSGFSFTTTATIAFLCNGRIPLG